ncbi:hypothetical protein GWI33_004273 [Rhynchophorus ferrugineus]|uniref:Uncharacterized protein n=1 Tax=Rhynchophorus ferrugineus TaxID=354439 RepID=A0A834IIW4_RHYFE|nr:hypothetical protein GWI33_004273 [Rhynchophorus ferrugineus]
MGRPPATMKNLRPEWSPSFFSFILSSSPRIHSDLVIPLAIIPTEYFSMRFASLVVLCTLVLIGRCLPVDGQDIEGNNRMINNQKPYTYFNIASHGFASFNL